MKKIFSECLAFPILRWVAVVWSTSSAVCLTLLMAAVVPIGGQDLSRLPIKDLSAIAAAVRNVDQKQPGSQTKRSITISDAVSIFLQQNLQLVAARYDISTAEAELLSAKVRPNPEIAIASSGLPIRFNGPFIGTQTFAYNVSQDLELGGKRAKRIDVAKSDAEVAKAQFQVAVWQMTNDVKKKF
ncbi:MAG TPA: TolC family protein, partial [Pyrinomonadaceae bacterium]|nr:TolC family protein [Pyrinomonadaceae bacterium]